MISETQIQNVDYSKLIYHQLNQNKVNSSNAERKSKNNSLKNTQKNQSLKPIQKKVVNPRNKAKQNLSIAQRLALSSTALVENIYSTIGFSFGLMYLQKYVNEKLIANKICNHYTSKINDPNELMYLGYKMRHENGLDDIVRICRGAPGDAYFYNSGKFQEVVLGKDSLSAIFHELGHAIVENKTKFFKYFQKNRNLDAYGAITLYMLLESAKYVNPAKPKAPKKEDKPANKIMEFILKYTEVLPLLIYSPELISEFGASRYGLKFLKKELKLDNIDKNLLKNIRNSYIAAFSTYLFIPLSLIFMSVVSRNSYNKKLSKKQRIDNVGMSMGAGVAGAVAAGGIAYASASIYDKKHGYANNVFDKILSSKQIANYPEATQKAATTFKVISDLNECLHYNPDLFIFKTNKKDELENFYEKFKGQIEKEIEKVYNPTKKRFINENKIDSNYQKLLADIKKVSKDMKWDALKKFTLPVGLSIAFVTYHLGRLTRTYHPDIDKKQRTPKK